MGDKINIEEMKKFEEILSLVNDRSQPNLNPLSDISKNIPIAFLNIKSFGYELARQLSAATQPIVASDPGYVGLDCRTSTQADIESEWAAFWCSQLQIPITYHRKTWELAYVLQVIHENGLRTPGMRGLGFGCGVEPLPSYLAAHEVTITMTDLPHDRALAAGWSNTMQHSRSLDAAHHSHLVDRQTFDRQVELRYVDMNDIPPDLVGYDFCWSICALEHLGSIENGLVFIRNALKTLRPGGLSVHTTEFNINPTGPTIDNWATVLFQRKHFEMLAEQLRAEGHRVAPLNFTLGDRPFDHFVDLPPFHHDLPQELCDWIGPPYHLKVAVDGFPSTCFGLIAWRGD